MSNYRISYAQNREDIILSGFFKGIKKGFYVDVGANHPDSLSITKNFYDEGWNGINLEPNRELYELIVESRPRDINLNLGAANKNGELTLREYPDGDGLSTFSKTAQSAYEKRSSEYHDYTRNYKDYKVPVRTLKDIFKDYNVKQINFMNIDVEGFEYQVIAGNDWDKYRPQVLCIEANHITEDWRPLLEKAKYDLVFFDGLNNYYVAHEFPEVAKKFSYVETVLLGKPIIAAHFQNTLDDYGRHNRNLGNKLTRQTIANQDLREEIDRLNGFIASQNHLRSHIKQVALILHKIILINIEKLNKVKVRRLPPLKFQSDLGFPDIMAELRAYDLSVYYGMKHKKRLSYKIIMWGYRFSARIAFKLARSIFKFVRKLTSHE